MRLEHSERAFAILDLVELEAAFNGGPSGYAGKCFFVVGDQARGLDSDRAGDHSVTPSSDLGSPKRSLYSSKCPQSRKNSAISVTLLPDPCRSLSSSISNALFFF